jgi:hypothetical protein
MIESLELDELVKKNYNKPYRFQQQEGSRSRNCEHFIIPTLGTDFHRNTIPEVIPSKVRGVSFKAWLDRDPKTQLNGEKTPDWKIKVFWERNFYPNPEILLNDLYYRGLIPAGELVIRINY